ncbi:hypothetical protein HDU93_003592, partial [Gonapodya sp. JEL0774]
MSARRQHAISVPSLIAGAVLGVATATLVSSLLIASSSVPPTTTEQDADGYESETEKEKNDHVDENSPPDSPVTPNGTGNPKLLQHSARVALKRVNNRIKARQTRSTSNLTSLSSTSGAAKKPRRPLPSAVSTKREKTWELISTNMLSRAANFFNFRGGRGNAADDGSDVGSDGEGDAGDDAETAAKKRKEKEDEEQGYRRIVEYYNNQIGNWEERKDDGSTAKEEEKIRFVVHTRHRVVRGEDTKDVYVKIKSPNLAHVLRECLPDNEQVHDAVPFLEVKSVFLHKGKLEEVVGRMEKEVKELKEKEETDNAEGEQGTHVEGDSKDSVLSAAEPQKESSTPPDSLIPEATAVAPSSTETESSAIPPTSATATPATEAASKPSLHVLESRLTDSRIFLTFLTAELLPTATKLSLLLHPSLQSIAYHLLWYIFPKGERVWSIDPVSGQPQAGQVEYSEYIWGGSNPHFGVDITTVEYSGGGKFSRPTKTIAVMPFGGLRKISTLTIVPLKFVPQKFKEELDDRGRKWLSLYGGR